MSMLAEKKQKQRWYLNPRANKEWAQDANKFGQRMLEKMGWTTGKGLGANEDGITDHIKVKYKNDIQGIGYQLRDDQWTQHENNFTQLLANLGGGTEAEKLDRPKPEKSLEKKSQTSRARVHYHKFTRGKDLAARSEKDLANIFGRKTLTPVKKIEKVESDNEDKESKAFGVVTIKSGNMADYFKSKFSKLGDKISSALNNKDDGDESESEIGGRTAGFGFNSGSKENKQSFINFVSTNSKSNEKDDESESEISTTVGFGFSSTYSNNKQNFMSYVSPSIQIEGKIENQNSGLKRKREEINLPKDKTKKKAKKKKNVAFDNKGNDINISEEVCYDNPCLNEEDCNEEQNTEENGLDNPAFNSNDESDRKTRKSVTFASPLAKYSTISEDSPKKKKKKQKKQELGIDNPACEEQSFEETPLDNLNEETNSKRKRKSADNLNEEESTPFKKSKKKKKNLEIGIENLACEEIDSNETTPDEETKTSKKKKISTEDTLTEETSTSKKKKKKSAGSDNGITNLACEESPVNCVDNLACSVNLVEEGIESITKAIDNYQSELENEMNLRKDKKMQKSRKLKNKQDENASET